MAKRVKLKRLTVHERPIKVVSDERKQNFFEQLDQRSTRSTQTVHLVDRRYPARDFVRTVSKTVDHEWEMFQPMDRRLSSCGEEIIFWNLASSEYDRRRKTLSNLAEEIVGDSFRDRVCRWINRPCCRRGNSSTPYLLLLLVRLLSIRPILGATCTNSASKLQFGHKRFSLYGALLEYSHKKNIPQSAYNAKLGKTITRRSQIAERQGESCLVPQ
ncbi:hypothetical protein DM860_011518 [Cuscuta australis]|uniref:Uncharacterized protein n=1 Tax=Cuscuta australis TaxID=267555 RepID=A0A328CZX4_9ASTE|nr:hypothetical protein DM860_011518 [Cuscuta australis]